MKDQIDDAFEKVANDKLPPERIETPIKKPPMWFAILNTTFKLLMASVPVGILSVVLAAIFGFFGGICSEVFVYFFNILGSW